MAEAEKISIGAVNDSKNRTSKTIIDGTNTAELIIALCGPIGSPLHQVGNILKKKLEDLYGYEHAHVIRLSDFINETKSNGCHQFDYIKSKISDGNTMRSTYGGAILAEKAIQRISEERGKFAHSNAVKHENPRRVCHIIDSIKNEEELNILKSVYRDMFYFMGVYSPLELRERYLEEKGLTRPQIHELIDQDSGEELDYGQTVRDTFPKADFFLRVDQQNNSLIDAKVEKFLDIILGTKVITPTNYETAMYKATSAAMNSACLSRQVGASIIDKDGNLISIGWNDVPKYGGSLYTTELDGQSNLDNRCWNKGACFNDKEKDNISSMLSVELVKNNFVNKDKQEELNKFIREQSKVKSLIEFSRSIHAEMHAILSAGASCGDKLIGSKLFCTTYPCHSCARHIIAAGIKEVYYIEPYVKSMAVKLHSDAITENEDSECKVRILPYEGVAPSRYLKLFEMGSNKRKKDGKLITVERKSSLPKYEKTLESVTALEGVVLKTLQERGVIDDQQN